MRPLALMQTLLCHVQYLIFFIPFMVFCSMNFELISAE